MKITFTDGIIVRKRNGQVSGQKEPMTIENGIIFSFKREVDADEVISLGGKWVFPGLINTHGHAGMTFLRGVGDDVPLETWLQSHIWPKEAVLTKEDIVLATRLAMIEMLKSGTTTFLDMYHPLYTNEIAAEVEKSGMRASIMGGMLGFGEETAWETKLQHTKSFIENWHQKGNSRITTMVAPHSTYTCPTRFLEKSLDLAKELGVGIHLHAAETKTEVENVQKQTGKRPIEYLHDLGYFECPTLLAHVVHVTDQELDWLQAYDVSVSHNPNSNLKLGSGIAPITKMMEKGINVSLGTDSVASNNNLDLIQEMRIAVMLQKGVEQKADALSLQDALLMATENGAKALQMNDIGTLQIGKKADFITINPQNNVHLQPEQEMISHFVYAASGQDIADVYVDGQCLMRDRELTIFDEEKIMFEAKQAMVRL